MADQPQEPVTLRVYDVSTERTVGIANEVLRVLGTGAFHAAVEVYGQEWSYGYCAERGATGVFSTEPGGCQQHTYREALPLGHTSLRPEEVKALLDRLQAEWLGEEYDLLERNCTHFSDALSRELGTGGLPPWVMNLGEAGQQLQSVYAFLQPHVAHCRALLRPWGELAALERPAQFDSALATRLQSNLSRFMANYLLVTIVFLTLMVLDVSHPARMGAVFSVSVLWVAFLRLGGRDPTWRPCILGFEVSARHRETVMVVGSALLAFAVLYNGLFLCAVLAACHAALCLPEGSAPGKRATSEGGYQSAGRCEEL